MSEESKKVEKSSVVFTYVGKKIPMGGPDGEKKFHAMLSVNGVPVSLTARDEVISRMAEAIVVARRLTESEATGDVTFTVEGELP